MREQSATRKELESAARRLVGNTGQMGSDASDAVKRIGPFAAVLAALLAFAWGRRRGRQRSAYVEVKRRK